MLAGAPNAHVVEFDQGVAYLFRLSTGQAIARLFDPEGGDFDRLGNAVALVGDRALVGAALADYGNLVWAGQVLEFDAATSEFQGRILPSDLSSDDRFGVAVALDGTTVIVGSVFDDDQGDRSGAAYVFDLAPGRPYSYSSACPCGNDDFDAGCANSTGSGALLVAKGSHRVAPDNLVLRASGLSTNQFAVLVMGSAMTSTPFGDGRLCLAGSLHRFDPKSSGTNGKTKMGPGLVDTACLKFGGTGCITAGATWNFQTVYRDPGGPCGAGWNVTNAVAVTFTP